MHCWTGIRSANILVVSCFATHTDNAWSLLRHRSFVFFCDYSSKHDLAQYFLSLRLRGSNRAVISRMLIPDRSCDARVFFRKATEFNVLRTTGGRRQKTSQIKQARCWNTDVSIFGAMPTWRTVLLTQHVWLKANARYAFVLLPLSTTSCSMTTRTDITAVQIYPSLCALIGKLELHSHLWHRKFSCHQSSERWRNFRWRSLL